MACRTPLRSSAFQRSGARAAGGTPASCAPTLVKRWPNIVVIIRLPSFASAECKRGAVAPVQYTRETRGRRARWVLQRRSAGDSASPPERQLDAKHGARPERALHCDSTAVRIDDASGDRQPEPRARAPGRRLCSPFVLLAAPPVELRVDAVFGELGLEMLPVHAELLRGVGDVALVALERLADELALEALDHLLLRVPEAPGPLTALLGRCRPDRGGQVLEADLGRRGKHDRLLDGVLELADVPLPFVRQQCPIRRRRQC